METKCCYNGDFFNYPDNSYKRFPLALCLLRSIARTKIVASISLFMFCGKGITDDFHH